jgi:ribosomal protein S18 acetylase RimI-like enzyme
MNELTIASVDAFPEPAFSALVAQAFSDYEESEALASVLDAERQAAAARHDSDAPSVRLCALRGAALVGWTFARASTPSHLEMINSGVAEHERRRGVYSSLVEAVIERARTEGYATIGSRHAAGNNAVIIAKLKLGFHVSGFEYSEVYGPLVRLTCLVSEPRRNLYKSRATPIRRPGPA